MKSMAVKILKNEYGLKRIQGKKVELYNFYTLCGFIKALRRGEEVK